MSGSFGRNGDGTNARKPRLLMLAYSFPPANRVGAVRAYNQAKYLTSLGWEVTVVTPHPNVWRQVERRMETRRALERAGIRFILTDHRWRFLSHDSLTGRGGKIAWAVGGVGRRIAQFLEVEREAGWAPEAERATAGLLPADVDLILASGPPFGSFRLAQRLSARLGRPYVLDYRDLWNLNPHGRPRKDTTIREERRLLQGAAGVVTVSNGLRQSLRERFGIEGISVVTNGYDPEDLESASAHAFGHFAIVYAGVFYPPKRVIHPIMEAISRLERTGTAPGVEWAFHYYGVHGQHVRDSAERFGVQKKVIVHGPVSRGEALSAIKGAGLAAVITSVHDHATVEDRGIVTGKVFDAIGLGTPFVAVAPPGSDLESILSTAGLGRRFSGVEVDKIREFFEDATAGRLPRPKDPGAFAWPVLVRQLDSVLLSVLRQHRAA